MLFKRLSLLVLLAALAISLREVLSDEGFPLEEFEEEDISDYEIYDESESEPSYKHYDHGYYPSHPPPPPPPPPAYPVPYQSAPPPPHYKQPPPPPTYHPVMPPSMPYVPAPVSNYSVPISTVYETEPAYPQVYPQLDYQQDVAYVSPIVENYAQPMSYQQQKSYQLPPPVASAYVPPAPPAQTYAAPAVQEYKPPVVQEYKPPAPPAYSPPPPPPYKSPAPVVANYSAPVPKPAPYVPPAQPASYAPAKANYVQAPLVKPYVPVVQYKNYSKYNSVPQRPQASAFKVYSPLELASIVPFSNYRSNHWSLFYYRSSPYRVCPKNVYLKGPSYKDIEAAFLYAQGQIDLINTAGIQYLNASQPSAMARHQIFSLMSQKNARMDLEGLIVEFVSLYLSDRACLTKWDKQRYLPSLTKMISVNQFPQSHSCNNYYKNQWQSNLKYCIQSKYRTFDGFCNNPYHPYWGKSNVCHIRLLSPDYADGISEPRNSYNQKYPLPNPRSISNYIHNEVPLDGPYNLLKMQWGQLINHDITNTALSAYDGLVDCCRNPKIRGCWPIYVPQGDKFYGAHNVTCLNFIRSGVCPTCQLGPRQQLNKNTAFLDASQIYGQTLEQANTLRTFQKGELKYSLGKNNEVLLPTSPNSGTEQCSGSCFTTGDTRVNQHPALTALHVLLLRNHNIIARNLALRHPDWNDEYLFQEARRLNIAEYQMITYGEYLPIVFGPILSAYYHLLPTKAGYTQYQPKVDPTTWNEYSSATCRFGHSQVQNTFGMYASILGYGHKDHSKLPSFRLKDWYMRPSLLSQGYLAPIINGLLSKPSSVVDPWLSNDVRNHLYQSHKEHTGGDLAATNIWRGRDHGIPGYVHYVEYCFNHKISTWKDLSLFIPYHSINQLKRLYRVPENIDLFTGGMAETHFPGADIGPTFACVNGIQYNHLKFGDRYWFEHGGQAGSFNPVQLSEIKRSTLAKFLCRTAKLQAVPQYAFLQVSQYNPLVNCSVIGDIDYNKF